MDTSPTYPQPTNNPPAKRAMVFASPLVLSPCVSPLSNNSPLHQSMSSSESAFCSSSSITVFEQPPLSSYLPHSSSSTTYDSNHYPSSISSDNTSLLPLPATKLFHLSLEHSHLSKQSQIDNSLTPQMMLSLSSLTPPPQHTDKHMHSSRNSNLHSYQTNNSSAFLPYNRSVPHSDPTSGNICETSVSSGTDDHLISSVPS